MKYYAGIGSRSTPPEVCHLMTRIAVVLARKGYTLRSGGAQGADYAFEQGAGKAKEIFRAKDAEGDTEAHTLAALYHPAWERLSPYVKNLMARNGYQLFGKNLHPDNWVEFIICWTPGGRVTGGTGQALRMAKELNIKVYNLGDIEVYNRFVARLKEL